MKTQQVLKELLKAEWQALEDQHKAGELDGDVRRAEIIARYESEGMTQREIAVAVELSFPRVNQLLRYNRYLLTAVNKIPERRFRAYWHQVRDPHATRGKREIDADYELKVLQTIAAMVEAGQEPIREKRKVKPSEVKELTPLTRACKAAREVRKRLKPTLAKLRGLLGCDRATFAPDIIAGHAQILEREINEFFKLLADLEAGQQ
jgi:transcriptional regulator with XRE-family HTH domain